MTEYFFEILSNSETWYNLTQKEICELETVDEILLRKIFSAHSKTPKEALYLESGNVPIRYILMARRVNFLHYIMNEEESSLLKSFFNAQVKSPVKGDWVLTVERDLKELQINQSFLEIGQTSKIRLKNIIREKIKTNAFNYLSELKETHSKVRKIKHSELKLQPFLASKHSEMTIKEKQFAVAARTRMLELKANFKVGAADTKCRRCEGEEETQEHLLHCPAMSDFSPVQGVPQYNDIFEENSTKIANIPQQDKVAR